MRCPEADGHRRAVCGPVPEPCTAVSAIGTLLKAAGDAPGSSLRLRQNWPGAVGDTGQQFADRDGCGALARSRRDVPAGAAIRSTG